MSRDDLRNFKKINTFEYIQVSVKKRISIILSFLLVAVFCFTQIAPGFLHRHCSELNNVSFEKNIHAVVPVKKYFSSKTSTFSDRCLICMSQGVPYLYLNHLTVSVISVESLPLRSFFVPSFYIISAESGSSRAPPLRLS